MKHDYLDRYSRIDSPVHRLQSPLKISIALGLILVSIVSPVEMLYIPAVVGIFLIVLIPCTRIPVWFVAKRILMFEPFVAVVATLALFQAGGELRFASIVLKSTVSLLTMILLSNTVPFNDFLGVLRRMRVPAVLVTILALMYRYLFVLIDEMERSNRARQSRTFSGGKRYTWYALSLIVSHLFVRSTERAERVFAAMSARGWKS